MSIIDPFDRYIVKLISDYSTQQIKYKEANIEIPVKEKKINTKNNEEDSDSIYQGKLLIQDR